MSTNDLDPHDDEKINNLEDDSLPLVPQERRKLTDAQLSSKDIFLSETTAVALLTFISVGAVCTSGIISDDELLTDRLLYIGLTYGLVYGSLMYAFSSVGNIRQLSPTITLALVFTRQINWTQAYSYWGAQILGTALAAGLLPLAFPILDLQSWEVLEGVNVPHQIGMSFICSMASTLVVVVTCWGWGDDYRTVQPVRLPRSDINRPIAWEQQPQTAHELNSVICGSVVAVCGCVGSAVTGGLSNPFLSFVIWAYSQDYIMADFLGPILGSSAAALACLLYISQRGPVHAVP